MPPIADWNATPGQKKTDPGSLSDSLSVTIDARLWGRTGIGRYVKELSLELAQSPERLQLKLLGAPSEAREVGDVLPARARIYSLREQVLGGLSARRWGRADVYHFPHYNVPLAAPHPLVVTVHDLAHFKFPEQFGRVKVWAARRVLARAVTCADAILTPSRATQRDLLAAFPNVAHKTFVSPNGVSSDFRPASQDEVETFRRAMRLGRYVLCMGDRKPYKRFEAALAAFERLHREDPQIELACAGIDLRHEAAFHPGVRPLGHVSDAMLRMLYAGAACLLFPSACEGFGLPVLEAFACSCPVVCSTGSALDELCDGAAVQVDGADPRSLELAARQVMEDADLRSQLIARGLVRAREYSWKSTAREVLRILRSAVKS